MSNDEVKYYGSLKNDESMRKIAPERIELAKSRIEEVFGSGQVTGKWRVSVGKNNEPSSCDRSQDR